LYFSFSALVFSPLIGQQVIWHACMFSPRHSLTAADVWNMSRFYVMLSLFMVRDRSYCAVTFLQLCNKLSLSMMKARSCCSATFCSSATIFLYLWWGPVAISRSAWLGIRCTFYQRASPVIAFTKRITTLQNKSTIQYHTLVLCQV